MWSYAVPSQDENASEIDAKDSYANGNNHASDDRKPLAQNTNQPRSAYRNTVRTKNSIEGANQQFNQKASQADWDDGAETNPDYGETYNANGSAATSASGANRKRVASRERSRIRRKGSRGAVNAIDEGLQPGDESKWIHRDKLAQIESRELAQLGVRVSGKSSRAGSRRAKSTKTDRSVVEGDDLMHDDIEEDDSAENERQPLRQAADEDQQQRYHANSNSMDAFADKVGQRNDDRPEDGDSPSEVSHKRSGSFNRQRQRARSQSGGQNMLDGASKDSKSGPNSPSTKNKGAAASKTRKPATTRKNSGSGQTRSRSNSVNESPKRPGTSGGSRPPTARPEGDPPWISTMYKPDPRLPPDQQMLPTHARRMAEMQRRAEEETRARQEDQAQDDEFRLLDSEEPTEEPANPRASQQVAAPPVHVESVSELETRENMQKVRNSYQANRASWQRTSDISEKQDSQWPLRTPSGHIVDSQDRNQAASPTKQSKHDSNSTEHGGYNLMPSVQQQNKDHSVRSDPRSSIRSNPMQGQLSEKDRQANAALAPVNQPVRLQDPEEDGAGDDQNSKGCKCCVVM